jgi:hypothetical protein
VALLARLRRELHGRNCHCLRVAAEGANPVSRVVGSRQAVPTRRHRRDPANTRLDERRRTASRRDAARGVAHAEHPGLHERPGCGSGQQYSSQSEFDSATVTIGYGVEQSSQLGFETGGATTGCGTGQFSQPEFETGGAGTGCWTGQVSQSLLGAGSAGPEYS